MQIALDILPSILKEVPYSTVFILSVAASISLLTTLVNRLITNPAKTKTARKEVNDWNKELREAQRNKDKKTVEKLMKKQQYIMQLQSKMMWSSMKVSLLFLIPLLLMWQLLGGFYTDPITHGAIAIATFPGIGANLPIPIFSGSLIWWYLVCSMLFGTIFAHLFGLTEVSE
jgi:uncharacterized membrane protein (DUF106 family)